MKTLRNWIYPLLFFTWVAVATANEELPVVAVAEFDTRSDAYENLLTARNLSSQVQAALANSDSLRLVERSQLELAANELALEPFHARRPGESLAVGRWVGADLIMLGTLDRNSEGLWNLELEVVDTIEADVLAITTFPLSRDPAQKPALDPDAFTPISEGLIKEALAAQARNGEANLVLSPLFFDFIGRLRNLEPLIKDFSRELQSQVEANMGVRLLRFPRGQHVQHEMEMRLDGLTEMARHRPTRTPVFFWGEIEEVEAEGKKPDEVPLRARVNIRANHGEQREIVLTGKVAHAPALMKELVHSVVDAAKQLSQAPMTAPGPNPVEGEKLRAHARRLRNEFHIRLHSREPLETLEPLGRHVDSLYQIAAFLSPDDPAIQRDHLMIRQVLLRPNQRLDFLTQMEINRRWKHFEQRFPDAHDRQSLSSSLQTALILLHGNVATGQPRDWPEQVRQQFKAGLEEEIIFRMRAAGPETLMNNSDHANWMPYSHAFDDAERRAEFTKMIWPVLAARHRNSRQGGGEPHQWGDMLRETFSAVGKPERVEALLTMLDRAAPVESHLPEDLRFMVRRPDILPPSLQSIPMLIASGGTLTQIDALHYDGVNLWVAAYERHASTTSEIWRRRIANTGRSNKLFRLGPGRGALEEIHLELPSKICAIASGNHHIWAGTQTHGILQLGRECGSLIRSWGISEGLPTRHVFALEATENTVTAGGGDRHRGHLFRISDGSDGVINKSVPGWREDIARWRPEDVPKSQFGEITILLHAHGRKLAVAGGSQAILWKEGGEDVLNLTESLLGGDSRFGASPQNGTVIAAAHDAQGWWLGSDAGLARLSPDGTVIRRWNTAIGGNFFEQKGWVPAMRTSGVLMRNFDFKTRLVGAVIALAADGEFLFVAVSTEADKFLPSQLEGSHLYVLHIPSGKWVGRVGLPARATAMAQDDTRLWIGHAGPSAVLLQFYKSALTSVPPEHHVADLPWAEELEAAFGKLSITEQACHAFFRKDYQRVVDLLGDLMIETASVGELFLLAFSNDKNGLARLNVARAYFEEILRRQPHSFWRTEAEQGLKEIERDLIKAAKEEKDANERQIDDLEITE